MSLPVWLPSPMFLLGESLSRGGGLCPEECLSRGGLCPGGLPDRPSDRDPPYGQERAVRILLECFLMTYDTHYSLLTEPRLEYIQWAK